MKKLQMYDKRWIAIVATVLGLTSVALGAFGAHMLKTIVTPERLNTWQTAVEYQIFHALTLFIIYILSSLNTTQQLTQSAVSISIGVLVFSGSLYALVLTDTAWLGMITPIGGVLMIIGWLFLLNHFLKSNPNT